MRTLQAVNFSPLYAQLMDQIRTDIRRGVYAVGSRIPPEHELEINYGVSRVTVRRALQELTAEGLLERKQGKGTFVSSPRAEIRERRPQGFHDACRAEGRVPGVRVIRVGEKQADAQERAELMLAEDSEVLECTRLLLADGKPVILETSQFSMAYAWLENADLNGSLYRLLQDYGVRAEKAIYDFSQREAGEKEAALLGTEPKALLMDLHTVVYDQKGRPLHISRQLIRGDRYTVRI